MAQVTLSYPGLEEWNIVPATVAVPVKEGRWWVWFVEYGPWLLGAILCAGIAWVVVRNRVKPGRTSRPT